MASLPSRVTRLALKARAACTVDFGVLAALQAAQLDCTCLHGAAAVAQLRQLRLGEPEEHDSGDTAELLGPWAAELLRHAPPQLTKLTLAGD